MSLLVALLGLLSGGRAWGRAPRVGAHVDLAEARVDAVDVDLVIHPRSVEAGGAAAHRQRARVEGRAVYRLERPSLKARELVLLDFASHLHEEPESLDEVTMDGYADGPWVGARTEIVAARVDGRATAVRRSPRGDVRVELPAGAEEIEIEYELIVPRRLWPFGCARGRCSLSGAVAPLPSAAARGGDSLGPDARVVRAARWSVDARFGGDGRGKVRGRGSVDGVPLAEPIVVSEGLYSSTRVAYPSVFWGGRWRRIERSHRGVELALFTSVHRPGDRAPNQTRGQLYPDAAGKTLLLVEQAIDEMLLAGLAPRPGASLLVMHGPLRSSIAAGHPSSLLVSDRAFQVFPSDRVRKFHEVAVVRAALDTLCEAAFVDRYDPSTRLWSAGMLSVALTRAWQVREELRDEFAEEILGRVTFMPAVDRFLYTSQAQFSNSYFRGSEDIMPLRNDPRWFANRLPTGRRIHEKSADLLSDPALARFYAALVETPSRTPESLMAEQYGRRLGWFFEQWLGPLPASDYAVQKVSSTRGEGVFHHEIVLVKDQDRLVVEPVWVELRADDDHVVRLVWNGEPAGDDEVVTRADGVRVTHVMRATTRTKLKSVTVDPRQRIVQTARIEPRPGARGDNMDPRFNDRVPKQPRFVYTGVGVSVAASEFASAKTSMARLNAVSAFLAFEASLRRDMRRTGNFAIFTDRETVGGVAGTASFFFGAPRNRQRRRLALRAGGGVSWLNESGLDQERGLRLSQTLGLSHSTVKFGWWPSRGRVLEVGMNASEALDPSEPGGDLRVTLGWNAGWTQYWRLAHHHVIASSLQLALVQPLVGRMEFRSLLRAGGIGGLGGFTGNELFGRGLALLRLEYRHLLFRHLSVNGLHVAWFRGLGGVLTGGAASLSSCDDLSGWLGASSWYGTVGYGIQAQLQLLGTLPQLIRVDASVPLGRRATTCLGRELPAWLAQAQGAPASTAADLLPPFTINVTFNHPF